MLSFPVYVEIKHQKWSTCVSFLSIHVCVKFGWKSAVGYRNFCKTASGFFFWTPAEKITQDNFVAPFYNFPQLSLLLCRLAVNKCPGYKYNVRFSCQQDSRNIALNNNNNNNHNHKTTIYKRSEMARFTSRTPYNIRCSYFTKQLVIKNVRKAVLSMSLKVDDGGPERMSSGILFQATAPPTQNARFPVVALSLVVGTTKSPWAAERRAESLGTVETEMHRWFRQHGGKLQIALYSRKQSLNKPTASARNSGVTWRRL